MGKERFPTTTRESKYPLVKEFLLYYENKRIKIFDFLAKVEKECCGLC
jgi:hypothetical protein